jgi:hypothetical protein
MRSSAALLLVAAAALVLMTTVGVARGRPRPSLGLSRRATLLEHDHIGGDVVTMMSGSRDLLGAVAELELDYWYVDPPPDTHRRGGSAPIPHN